MVTDRDLEILRWIGRHGLVTREQVSRRFFARQNGDHGQWAAYRRVRILVQLGLIQQDYTFYREPAVLRLTTDGAQLAQTDVRPARLVLAEVRHSLAVVDLIEFLLAAMPKTTELLTERELRAARRRELRNNPNSVSDGRMPDAVLLRGAKRIAVELDLTSKRSKMYQDILDSYIRQRYDAVWWYVAPGVVGRLKQIVHDNRADDLVSVQAWGR